MNTRNKPVIESSICNQSSEPTATNRRHDTKGVLDLELVSRGNIEALAPYDIVCVFSAEGI